MTLLLLQITMVLLVTLACGSIARRLGQARVIGEIIGGLLLGPSVFGRLAPQAWQRLFPASFAGPFEVLSTTGLILFLFLIGSELDYKQLREHRRTTALASAMSIVLPFVMTLVVAQPLYRRFAPPGIGLPPFTLFLGIAMSITAFPVLARILEERGQQTTRLGTTALLSAAVGDVLAWLLLAVALALLPTASSAASIPQRLVWLAIYLIMMLGVLRPLGQRLARRTKMAAPSYGVFALTMALVLASSAATEAIGVHPLFGAFLAGLCFPRISGWQASLRARLDTIVSTLLLPLFFALTGMRTRLDVFSNPRLWLWAALILLVAVTGKVGGAVLASRWSGRSWQEAWALGALLNTRGLVELIVLNIAYNAHVFSASLFAMLVVMALLTTMMTNPLLNLLGIQDGDGERLAHRVIEVA